MNFRYKKTSMIEKPSFCNAKYGIYSNYHKENQSQPHLLPILSQQPHQLWVFAYLLNYRGNTSRLDHCVLRSGCHVSERTLWTPVARRNRRISWPALWLDLPKKRSNFSCLFGLLYKHLLSKELTLAICVTWLSHHGKIWAEGWVMWTCRHWTKWPWAG